MLASIDIDRLERIERRLNLSDTLAPT